MKYGRFIIFLFYKAFDRGKYQSIAYEAGLMFLSFFLFMSIDILTIAIGIQNDIIPFKIDDDKLFNFVKMAIFMVPVYLSLSLLFKKNEIITLEYDKEKVRRGIIWLVVCGFIFLILFVVLAMWKNITYMYILKHR